MIAFFCYSVVEQTAMASAYIGTTLMPPLFGLIANNISVRLFPGYILLFLILMFLMHEQLLRKVEQ